MGAIFATHRLYDCVIIAIARHLDQYWKFVDGINTLLHINEARHLSRRRDLWDNLVWYRYCAASDPRDKVYGVLGISFKPGE